MDYLASWWWWTLLLVVPTFVVVGLELFGSICLNLGFEIDLLSFALTCKIISKVITWSYDIFVVTSDGSRSGERLVQLPAITSRMVSLGLIAEPNTTHSELIPTNAEFYLLETILPFLKPSYSLPAQLRTSF